MPNGQAVPPCQPPQYRHPAQQMPVVPAAAPSFHQQPVPTYVHAVSPYNQPQAAVSTAPADIAYQSVATGIFAFIVVSAGTMGASLHRVSDGDMTMREAANNSLSRGTVGGLAVASGTAVASAFTDGGLTGLATSIGTAIGVSYLLAR